MTKESLDTRNNNNNDWRDMLFVWDGILVASSSSSSPNNNNNNNNKDNDDCKTTNTTIPLKWEGTWIGTTNKDASKIEAPKRGAFDELVASDMHFHVTGSATSSIQQDNDDNGQRRYFQASLTEGPGWDDFNNIHNKKGDDTNETKKKHSDDIHNVYLENVKWTGNLDNPTCNLLFATGKNEYGSFISTGWMRPGNRLTLARRYITEDDSRAEWSLEDLRKAVIEEVVVDGKAHIPPWQCEVMNCEYNSKKRPLDDGDEKEKGGEKKAKE